MINIIGEFGGVRVLTTLYGRPTSEQITAEQQIAQRRAEQLAAPPPRQAYVPRPRPAFGDGTGHWPGR